MNQRDQEQKHTPKVSIGMPVYNGEKFIFEALDSLIAQTFTDFELIISDNASTDGTEAICREYAARDPRIRYVRQSENRGPVANFQFVLDEAAGKYFMWAAADDEWSPTFVSECCTVLENDSSIGFVVTKAIVASHFSPLCSRWCIPDLECVTDPDRERRVLKYSSMPFNTHKDNLVYGLWRSEVIAGILVDLRQSPLGKIVIGTSMNEYALSLYKGGFVKKILFRKKYRFFPPGHKLEQIADFASRVIRHLGRRERGNENAYSAEQHLNDLRAVLQLGLFDESYISRVIDANKYHLKFRKALR
ncbi:MAG: glycosyltransferase family 2 protein [Sulfuricella sp.]